MSVLGLQALSGPALALAVLGCALAARILAPSRTRRLLKRVRFLLIAIVVFFAWFTPGEALLVAIPVISPSSEGVMFAMQHAGRLLGVVCCVAILLERLSVSRLVTGLYALLRPFEAVGLPARGLAVRLLLVMQYVESASPRGWRDWLDDESDSELQTIQLGRERLGMMEAGITVVGIAVLVVLGFVR
ncbi:CbiQ family ECF transporter T component [Aromatoleum sp.]|uniref:CbiQ family ECF transporter T component n=1 Tax=Aromatoleum sp. TaxID=2307007 RepID=UPI002FCAC85E